MKLNPNLIDRRMQQLGVTKQQLIEEYLLDENTLSQLLDGQTNIEDIDDYDLRVLVNALYCDEDFLCKESSREKDLLYSFSKKQDLDIKTNKAIVYAQNYVNDYLFIEKIVHETTMEK